MERKFAAIFSLFWITAVVGLASGASLAASSADPRAVVTLLPEANRAVGCCADSALRSCAPAEVNAERLLKASTSQGSIISLPKGIEVKYSHRIGEDNIHKGFQFTGNDSEAVLTYSELTGGMHGHVATHSGDHYVLEFCGNQDGHVWKELAMEKMDELTKDQDAVISEGGDPIFKDSHFHALQNYGMMDNTTKTLYTIKFYYTPEFKSATPDIHGFINQIIVEINEGYKNSGAAVRAQLLCIEKARLHDDEDLGILHKFANMKGSVARVRDAADVAVLLVHKFSACGVGYFDTAFNGKTLSVVRKSCAVGYYSVGHEIGHNFGLHHDKDVAHNYIYPHGNGYLIPPMEEEMADEKGFRTIMAYRSPENPKRVNFYSNPDVMLPMNGQPTGTDNANNVAVLQLNRFVIAGVGDESSKTCNMRDFLA